MLTDAYTDLENYGHQFHCHNTEDGAFMLYIVTGDETWISGSII